MPKNRTFRWRPVVEQAVGILILVAVGWYFWERRDTIAQIVDVSLYVLLALIIGVLLSWTVVSWQSYLLFRAQGIEIGFMENLIVTTSMTFGNYLPMRIGTIVRIRYMKTVHGMRYARFGSMTGMRIVLMQSATGLLGLIGVVGLWATQGTVSVILAALFLAIFLVSVAAFSLRVPRATGSGLIRRVWNDFIEGFDVTRSRPGVALQVMALVIAQYALLAWRLQVSLAAVGVEASFFLLAMLGPLTALVSALALTPGGLGVREALIGYVTFEVGMTFDIGMIAGAVDRAVVLCLVAVLGSLSFGYVWWGVRGRGSPTRETADGGEH
jgi:uncharacterized membrane protein YbhN (UPF0104 family)